MLLLQKQMIDVIRKFRLFNVNDRIVLGISGGPDSVALLNLLIQANCTDTIYSKLYLAHLNHLLREEESEQDEQFVKNVAKECNLPLIVERSNIRKCARKRKLSIEEAAREERYLFLGTVAKQSGAGVIAVGHTADDNAETVLHRIIRGTGVMGLNGMRPKRKISPFSTIELVRPLLLSWRKDIMTYLNKMNISYRTDSTNLVKNTFRNRCRLELIPLLERNYNVNVKQSLVKLGEISTQNYDFLKSQADEVFKKILLDKSGETDNVFCEIVLDITPLKKTPGILQQIIMREAVTELGIPLKKFGHNQYNDIIGLLKREGKSLSRTINGYVNMRINDNKLYLSRAKNYADKKPGVGEVELLIPGETKLMELKYTFKTEIRDIENGFLEKFKQNKTEYDEAVDLKEIRMPLTVRTRREGDKFCPLGSKGFKKLKDFFIDSKVPRMDLDKIPIVTMHGQPVWVVGYRIDDRIRIGGKTEKLLLMKAERH